MDCSRRWQESGIYSNPARFECGIGRLDNPDKRLRRRSSLRDENPYSNRSNSQRSTNSAGNKAFGISDHGEFRVILAFSRLVRFINDQFQAGPGRGKRGGEEILEKEMKREATGASPEAPTITIFMTRGFFSSARARKRDEQSSMNECECIPDEGAYAKR